MAESQAIRFGIFPKMLIAMTLMAVIPLGAIWAVNTKLTSQRVTSHVDQRLGLVADGLLGHVESWVQMNLRMLRENAELSQMRSMETEQQNPLLKLITEHYDWIYLAHTIGLDGYNVGRSDFLPPKFYQERAYYQQVLDGKPYGQQVLIGKTSGKPAFVLAVPIGNDSNALRGVLTIAMTIAELSDRIAKVRIGSTGQAFLVDEAGRVIAHQNAAYTQERRDLSGHPAVIAAYGRDAGMLTFTDEKGERRIAAWRRTTHGWTLVTEQAHAEAFAELASANGNALILLVVTLVVVALVASLWSRRLSAPIRQLTAVADAISHGKFDQPVGHLERGDELGALARAVDRLGTSVRLALQRLARHRKSAGAARA